MEDEWIDVNVVLPPTDHDQSDDVLVAAQGRVYYGFYHEPTASFYVSGKTSGTLRIKTPLAGKRSIGLVPGDLIATHWQPIPEPPRG